MHSNQAASFKFQAAGYQAAGSRLSSSRLSSNQVAGSRQSSFWLARLALPSRRLQASSMPHAALLFACRFFLACNLLACSLASSSAAQTPETIYIVNDYRYVPANATDDQEIGLSLCGTRCNALSTDFRNILEPMGYQMIKGAANQELTVQLNSPFIKGHCICIADEFIVKIDNRNSVENRRPRVQEKSAVNNKDNL